MAGLSEKVRINLEKANVLLVAPYHQGMDILGQIFSGFGVRGPRRSEKPGELMDLLKHETVDLIVCDGDMDNGVVYDFVRELRSSNLEPNRFSPIIIVTGHTPMHLVAKARDCGANFMVAKPLTPRILLERITWIAVEQRNFIELDSYSGPDRRFQNLGPPGGGAGRRRDDKTEELGIAATPNLSQNDIDSLVSPTKAQL